MKSTLGAAAMLFGAGLSACTPQLTDADIDELATMTMTEAALPPSPTNQVADDPQAVALGRLLFFDERMSSDQTISCASCHDPDAGWSDSRPLSLGVADREGRRHSMPIPAAALQSFLLWDGRADSLWSQAIKAIESHPEMDFSRTEVAHFIAGEYAADYEAIFGPMPSLQGLPTRALPDMPEWEQLDTEQRDLADEILANVGNVIEAYERQLLCDDTRFDRWVRGEVSFTAAEQAGAAIFVQGGCVGCHSGPAFSDGLFHNIGIGSGLPEPDRGRSEGLELLAGDPFNGAGRLSADSTFGEAKLAATEQEQALLGAFRTPTLRGVGQRRFFGHRGHVERLGSFISNVYDGPRLQSSAVGELDPLVRGLDVEGDGDLIAFLRTLDCPAPGPELARPW
jgi:cytochrome c peroxidase